MYTWNLNVFRNRYFFKNLMILEIGQNKEWIIQYFLYFIVQISDENTSFAGHSFLFEQIIFFVDTSLV